MKTFKEFLNEANPKIGCIVSYNKRTTRWVGTVEELTRSLGYTLEVGASYAHERGNKKINLKPKTVKALAKELEKALGNSGNSGSYSYDDCTEEEVSKYIESGAFNSRVD